MAKKPDGGHAFPRPKFWPTDGDPDHDGHAQGGMSLRDYFAGQALTGFFAAAAHPQSVGITELDAPKLTADCYAIADAMIAEREKPESAPVPQGSAWQPENL